MFAVICSDTTGETITGQTAEFIGGALVVTNDRHWLRWEAEAILATDPDWLRGGSYYVADWEG